MVDSLGKGRNSGQIFYICLLLRVIQVEEIYFYNINKLNE